MNNKSFLEVTLIEIIISVLIFAISGVIILKSFGAARYTQIKANDMTMAGIYVQSTIEIFKSADKNDEIIDYLDNNFMKLENYYVQYYDNKWNISHDDDREYIIKVYIYTEKSDAGVISSINIEAKKIKPYPFLEKNDSIYSISTKKFLPNFNGEGTE